jgi:pilus assembly protein TadC
VTGVVSACLLGVVVAGSPWWTGGVRRARRPADRLSAVARRRRRRRSAGARVDAVLLLDIVDAGLSAGASIPRTLQVVGGLLDDDDGRALARAGGALLLGASWSAAWAGSPLPVGDLADALEPAWRTGSAPGPSLRARAGQVRAERRTRVRAAAATLGVHLVLPLGLCFLPAFVLLGLVPLVISLASGLLG